MKRKHHNRSLTQKVNRLKQQCPMDVLLRKLGLGRHAKSSCSSPFRVDIKPSWGIFRRRGHWFFKDLETRKSGDEITLIAMFKKWDVVSDFRKIVDYYEKISKQPIPVDVVEASPPSPVQPSTSKPDLNRFWPGTTDQLQRLSQLRGISLEALMAADERGFLIFGVFSGFEVYGVRDGSNNLGELRRLDGQMFPPYKDMPQHKSHTLKGSKKNWPLGVVESAAYSTIMLVEGLPDFLASFDFIINEQKLKTVAPVAMLSAATLIGNDALPLFTNKRVRIYPHFDQAGINAAVEWSKQLKSVGCNVDCFKFSSFPGVNDLCDFNIRLQQDRSIYTEEALP